MEKRDWTGYWASHYIMKKGSQCEFVQPVACSKQ